jgi:acyl carrier protein phosphodiesterase
MRTTSLKTIYLTIPELKEAITRYIHDAQRATVSEDLWVHLMNNEWSMDWASEGEEFVISIDGEIKDE